MVQGMQNHHKEDSKPLDFPLRLVRTHSSNSISSQILHEHNPPPTLLRILTFSTFTLWLKQCIVPLLSTV